jgi:hypothetical protein
MAQDIVGSKMPTFPSQHKKQKFYRGATANDSGYGENGYTGPSSVQPAGRKAANLSDLDTAPPKGDAVLDALIDGGKADISGQTRTVSAAPLTPSYGMKAPARGPQVPAKTGTVASAPVRKPS